MFYSMEISTVKYLPESKIIFLKYWETSLIFKEIQLKIILKIYNVFRKQTIIFLKFLNLLVFQFKIFV